MITLHDINTIECDEEASMEEYYLAIQKTINSGLWSMQGSYGRTMMDAISAGLCMLGQNQARDYYGNIIPSRDDVKPGTKGSYQFVVDERGEEWANLMLGAE
jgi:hypothetical protein